MNDQGPIVYLDFAFGGGGNGAKIGKILDRLAPIHRWDKLAPLDRNGQEDRKGLGLVMMGNLAKPRNHS
jgi:hypothetical protein